MRNWLFFAAILLVSPLSAQSNPQNVGTGILAKFSLGGQVPGGDLAARFGPNMNFGGGLDLITKESNFLFGLEGYYLFGNSINENVLSNLAASEGAVIAADGGYADIQLRERGFYIGAMAGKLFSLSTKNPRSGIRLTVGAGLLQHQIRIQDDPFRYVPQLRENYKKGYDRLTNGLAFNQFVGYQVLSMNKRVNFYIGLEFTQGFTQSRRDFNFDTRTSDTKNRFDTLTGVRAGWILPFYVGKSAAEIYY
jgi:hypothetical protein